MLNCPRSVLEDHDSNRRIKVSAPKIRASADPAPVYGQCQGERDGAGERGLSADYSANGAHRSS